MLQLFLDMFTQSIAFDGAWDPVTTDRSQHFIVPVGYVQEMTTKYDIKQPPNLIIMPSAQPVNQVDSQPA